MPARRGRLARRRPIRLPLSVSPALVAHEKERADAFGNRLADRITRFSGSMTFVHLHVLWFGCWIRFGVEAYPYGLLTNQILALTKEVHGYAAEQEHRGATP